ncbi:MAG: glycosyltransferase family 4 protein [bacterium]|nr:glycosyltransferase family 4 protein [bacterium]
MQRLRVLALVADAYGGRGGIAQFNRNLIGALLEHDAIDVRGVSLNGAADSAIPPGLEWESVEPGGKAAFGRRSLLAALQYRPDLIISGLPGFGPLAWPLKALVRSRLWTITHGVDVWEPGPFLDNLALRRSELVTTVSHYTRQRVLEWCAIPPQRVEVLHNTIDLQRFTPGPRPAELVRRFEVDDTKVLVTVGRLASWERYKGHDRVIPLLRELRDRIGPLRYLIAGEGDDRPRLEALVRETATEDLVTFAGYVPDEQLLDLYRLADVFVMPSTGEGFGIVFLEAMATGCPVIAGNRDGSVDALANGELGRLVDPDSPEELLAALAATLATPRSHEAPIPGVDRFELSRFHGRVHELVARWL